MSNGMKQQSLMGFFGKSSNNTPTKTSSETSSPASQKRLTPASNKSNKSATPHENGTKLNGRTPTSQFSKNQKNEAISSPLSYSQNHDAKSKATTAPTKSDGSPESDVFGNSDDYSEDEFVSKPDNISKNDLKTSTIGKRKNIILDDDDNGKGNQESSAVKGQQDESNNLNISVSKKPRKSEQLASDVPSSPPEAPSSPLTSGRDRLRRGAAIKSTKRPIIVSDDSDDDANPDDDDFIVSDGHVSMEDDSDDNMDQDISNEEDNEGDGDEYDEEVVKPKKSKAKTPKSSTKSSKSSTNGTPETPALKAFKSQMQSSSLGSSPLSASSSFKTKGELKKEAEKKKKAENEAVFDFLVDIKDADGNRPGDPTYDPRTLYIPNRSLDKLSPFEKQFWDIKRNHFDTVLFFQKGKFYELYENDADIGHQEFDLKITDRVKMRMVGVPEMQLDHWASMFLAKGYKVGRVDQSETAIGKDIRQKDAKGSGKPSGPKQIVNRELKSVLTTGTIVDGKMLTADDATYCVAIKEYISDSSSPPRFGICVIDTATACVELTQFNDDIPRTTLETVLRQKKPKELIHEKGNVSPATLRVLRNTCPLDCQWTALKTGTEFLTSQDAMDGLRKLLVNKKQSTEDDDEIVIDENEINLPKQVETMKERGADECLSALGAMISYLQQLNLDKDIFTCGNYNLYDPLKHGSSLILDGQTLAHIEVLQNSMGTDDGTLLRLLARCVTPFGKRQFRTWLCQPLRDVDAINARLDAVEDLIGSPEFQSTFDDKAKGLPDLERLISRIHAKSVHTKDFLKVLNAFTRISKLHENLLECSTGFKSKLINVLLKSLPEYDVKSVKNMFTVEDDELIPLDGADVTYDSAVESISSIENELNNCLEKYKKELKCKSLEWKDVGSKEIYQVQVPKKVNVPNSWTRLSQTKDYNRYWTTEVQQLVAQLREQRERRTNSITEFKYKVFEKFDESYELWLTTVRCIAQIDCLLSLAKASTSLGEPCVRPEIVEAPHAIVEFESLRHPCVISPSGEFIPNDVSVGGGAKSTILLTGPNMAGKSTLLRMVSVGVIMAQLGCYVPATKARIAPVDKIHTRLGANDRIFASASTFMVEMQDASKILAEATPKSLVILDELGRGTATFDGLSIAYATLHRLATYSNCLTIFATHYNSLVKDFEYHPQIRPCHMLTQLDQGEEDEDARDVIFLYKLVDGATTKSYGPKVAALAGVPRDLVKRATEVSGSFEINTKHREASKRTLEQFPLGLEADAAWLCQRAQAEKFTDKTSSDTLWSLTRTLHTIRGGVKQAS